VTPLVPCLRQKGLVSTTNDDEEIHKWESESVCQGI